MGYTTGKYQKQYDEVAQDYEKRLAAASADEEARARELHERTRADTEAQHAQQTNLAYSSAAGLGAGGDPSRLRAAAYAGSEIGQQHANDAAMMAAVEDQAYREQMMGVLGRRGEYGMAGMGYAADMYGMASQREAYERMQEEKRKAQEAQETAEWMGLAAGVMGAGIGGGM